MLLLVCLSVNAHIYFYQSVYLSVHQSVCLYMLIYSIRYLPVHAHVCFYKSICICAYPICKYAMESWWNSVEYCRGVFGRNFLVNAVVSMKNDGNIVEPEVM